MLSMKDLWSDCIEMWQWIRDHHDGFVSELKERFWKEVKGREPPEELGLSVCWLCNVLNVYPLCEHRCRYCPLRACGVNTRYNRLVSMSVYTATYNEKEWKNICNWIINAHLLYEPYLDDLDNPDVLRKVGNAVTCQRNTGEGV